MGQPLTLPLLAAAEQEGSNPGGLIVGAAILALFIFARIAYIADVRRRRRLGSGLRIAEKEAMEDEG